MDLERTGRFIAEKRKEKQLTQKQLAEKLHVTDRAVSKWETGRSFPDVNLLEDLCRELEVGVSDLLAGKRLEEREYRKETERFSAGLDRGESGLLGLQPDPAGLRILPGQKDSGAGIPRQQSSAGRSGRRYSVWADIAVSFPDLQNRGSAGIGSDPGRSDGVPGIAGSSC